MVQQINATSFSIVLMLMMGQTSAGDVTHTVQVLEMRRAVRRYPMTPRQI
jgi:hypothetical protein